MSRPNVLFLFPDTHRGDWMPYAPAALADLGMEALPLRMPHIEALMKQGVTFTKAVTSSPLCAPARACLASGLRYNKPEVAGNHENYSLSRKTFYSELKNNGYRVGGVGKFDLHKATHWWGLEGWIDELSQLGFTDAIDNAGKIDAIISGKQSPKDPYMSYLYKEGLADIHLKDMTDRGQRTDATDLPDEAYCDNWLTRNGLQMLETFPADQPWFLMVNFVGPHEPWDITHRMKAEWEHVQFKEPNSSSVPEQTWNRIRQNYAAMLANIDRNIGLLLDAVKRRGDLDNTVIIYASDHGDMLGDFDEFGKCKPERGSVHIPLVISGPGIRKGQYSDALVELQDLASTILDLADLSMEEAEDSISLKSVLRGEAKSPLREVQISGLDDGPQHLSSWRMACDGEWKLIVERDRGDRLYHVQSDPWENRNVAGEYPEVTARLKDALQGM
ncbi:sulfatase family protein [Paenibacillus planticolens]|uniref:Sulfatase-like hydrolase/transferase n=1 Tax=Paenibacillus planticolens TaxID=2654976 RepID=A0ABX1ZWZ2_9BACL|nr:sulfatase-like hydrolase/transferase [Paenibacillus planticolens]NOV04198.1 sulfatase-like hydrolase/transferase [Paenibacillus planticolens]